ncbi:MAG: CopG family transcriptional regulator [Acidobacteria bacterium]|nr:CopG family transcriptional regulator [Acidobacteriota bacterium]
MKTTLNFDEHLIRTAKIRAAQQGDTLTRLIERALRDYLQAGPRDSARHFRAKLLTKRGRAVAGVNLDDRDALYERMEATD